MAALEHYERLAETAAGLEAKGRNAQLLKRLGHAEQAAEEFQAVIEHARSLKCGAGRVACLGGHCAQRAEPALGKLRSTARGAADASLLWHHKRAGCARDGACTLSATGSRRRG